jgi:hypothetical protein
MTVDCGLKNVTQVSYAIYILTVSGKHARDSSSDSSSEEEAPSQPAPKKKGRGKASPKKQPKTASSIVKASQQAGYNERSREGGGRVW